jgi:Lar family restriction alleviation protein
MSETKLKTCPFCGEEDIQPAPRRDFPVASRCRECGAEGPEKLTGADANAAWNERKDERYDKLRQAVDTLLYEVQAGLKPGSSPQHVIAWKLDTILKDNQ